MTLYFGADEVDILWEGDDEVSIRWEGSDEVFNADAGPAPTPGVSVLTIDYVLGTQQTVNIGGTSFTFTPRRHPQSDRNMIFDLGGNSAQVTPLFNALRDGDGSRFVNLALNGTDVNVSGTSTGGGTNFVTFSPLPAAVPNNGTLAITTYSLATGDLLLNRLRSGVIAANRAWGVFSNLNWTFSHGGTDYVINGWFTDQNGVHIRFANQTQALAFIAAGLTVDSGIDGAPIIDSSEMVNAPAIDARTGPSFTQRYAVAEYIVRIST